MRKIDARGWIQEANHAPSTHYNARPENTEVSLVVLHNISLPPGRFMTGCVESFFLGSLDLTLDTILQDLKGVNVSSHFLIARDGAIIQFVGCNDRAWHAGVSSFLGRDNCNDFSIGIEIEGTDTQPFEAVQYDALIELLAAICERYPIRAIVGHSDIAPGRKTDPGVCFDWGWLQENRDRLGRVDFPGAAAKMVQAREEARAGILV